MQHSCDMVDQLPLVVAALTCARVTLMPTVSVGVVDLEMLPPTLARSLMAWPAAAGMTVEACGDVAAVRTTDVVPAQVLATSFHPVLQASIVKVAVEGVPLALYVAAMRLIVPEFPIVKNCGGYEGCPVVPALGNFRVKGPEP